MSASLVGSEMCIRDRARTARRREEAPHVGVPERHRANKTPVLFDKHYFCLLYTSDAADDM
eukprot:4726378-Alexandrium_andersonii.AAC.1